MSQSKKASSALLKVKPCRHIQKVTSSLKSDKIELHLIQKLKTIIGCHALMIPNKKEKINSKKKKSFGWVKEFLWQFECFNHCPRNLLATVSWSQLSHKELSDWHCHKITELERIVPHTVVLRRKCYLFILDLSSTPSPKSCIKTLGVWCVSIVSIPLFAV